MEKILDYPKLVLALGASASMVIISFKIDPSDVKSILVHVSDMVKECAITARSNCIN